ncbi:O-antigen ligase family protein [Clostridium algidicarnis]|uniref:O-antigen ligase family protein n=1 Tax=Clostridium algidicarnis TaxID=37659 RepID=UPI000496CCC6|nr:O-antigen ligase family protein [Clostridium algidicarnis]
MQLSNKVKKTLLFVLNCYLAALLLVPRDFNIYKNVGPADSILCLLFIFYFIAILRSGNIKKYVVLNSKKVFKNKLIKSMLLLFVFMVVSTIYASNKLVSIGEAFRFFSYILIGIMIYLELNNKSFFRMIITNYFVMTGIICIFGIIQFFTGKGISTTVIIMDKVNRVQSTLGNPNAFGAFLVISFFPLLSLLISEKSKKIKWFYGFNLLLISINIVLSFSRNSWLAWTIGIVVLALLYSYKFLYILALGGAGALVFPSMRGRLLQFTDVSQNMSRINIWRVALKMIKEHPFKGIGNGNFSALYDNYVEKYPELWMEDIKGYPSHNSFLKVFSELGVFAFIIFIALMGRIIKTVNFLRKNLKGYYGEFYTGFFISLIVMIILNLFDNIFFAPQVAVHFWIFAFIAEYIRENIVMFNN